MFNLWFYFSYDRHKHLRASLFWVFRKKEIFACTIFSKICYVARTINRAGKLICLRVCLHAQDQASLIEKPESYGACWVKKYPKNVICLNKQQIKDAVAHILFNCYFTIGPKIFCKIIGIPTGVWSSFFFCLLILIFLWK